MELDIEAAISYQFYLFNSSISMLGVDVKLASKSKESKSQAAAAEYTARNQNILCQIKQKLGLHQLTQTPNTKYVFVTTRRGN